MTRYLAESENYKVTSDDENVTLHFKKGVFKKSYIGHFYGDPESAIISKDEKYLVISGNGLVIYKLEPPFEEYGTNENTKQYFEFFRDPDNIWWTNGLHQKQVDLDWKYFRFVAVNDEGEFVYRMDSVTFDIENMSLINRDDILR